MTYKQLIGGHLASVNDEQVLFPLVIDDGELALLADPTPQGQQFVPGRLERMAVRPEVPDYAPGSRRKYFLTQKIAVYPVLHEIMREFSPVCELNQQKRHVVRADRRRKRVFELRRIGVKSHTVCGDTDVPRP